jgi:hypothetical protein
LEGRIRTEGEPAMVDTRLYTDPDLFHEEQVNIFARTWI